MGCPTAVDLFSGCGGLTLGLKRAGFDVLGAVEIDGVAVQTYMVNHPEVRAWHDDIRALDPLEIARVLGISRGDLDLLAGCPPCQGFSSLRTLNGHKSVADDRNDLVLEFFRFIQELRPKAFIMENVPGLRLDARFKTLVSDLIAAGYRCSHAVLNAADYGVPQRRKRLVLIGALRRAVSFAPPQARRITVRDVIGRLPEVGESGDPLHDQPSRRSPRIMNLIKQVPRDGGGRLDLGTDAQLKCHQDCNGFKDVYGRMSWDSVAPTITSGCFNPSKGRFLHPEADRAISLREAALIQGFPADYFFPGDAGKVKLAGLIGNGFPPEFAKCQAEHLRIQLG